MITEPIRARARNRWRTILPLIGIDTKFLSRKNGPCPMCGGKTKFRFTDKDGVGLWICNDCGGGDGADLVMKFKGVSFKDAAIMIEEVIGQSPKEGPKPQKSEAELLAAMRASWNRAKAPSQGGPVERYLIGRGLKLGGIAGIREDVSGAHPVMLAKVISPDGKAVNVHRTFLRPEGHQRFMMEGATPVGSHVRLAPACATLGIAEGIETALSARDLFDVPVWAALNAANLEAFTPPEGVEHLMIFGDCDDNHHGQKAAETLAWRARRAKLRVTVQIPTIEGQDWNDVLRNPQSNQGIAA